MYISITDQCYREVTLQNRPLRIISLVPSQTELLIALGVEENLVGITRYCVHPAGLTDRITVVGGTKKVVTARLYELQPDLIICNKEENTPQIVMDCDQIAPTYVSDIATLDDALEMIVDLGKLTGASFKAKSIANTIKIAFNGIKPVATKPKVLYLIWQDPYMSIGVNTFINDMLQRAGFDNVTAQLSRYPELTLAQMVDLKPDVIMLSSEPYAFNDVDRDVVVNAFAKAESQPKVVHVDGEMFSWYGSRLTEVPSYLDALRVQFAL